MSETNSEYSPQIHPVVPADNLPDQSTAAAKPPVSLRKIEANRQNAKKSSGPQTAQGKANSRRNATKHGLLVRNVVITAGDGQESPKLFRELFERFLEHYQPANVAEELLVQEIAACWWRKARVLRAENGETRKRLDCSSMDSLIQSSDRTNLAILLTELPLLSMAGENRASHKVPPEERFRQIQSLQLDLRRDVLGLKYLASLLERAKEDIANKGFISPRTNQLLLISFGFWDSLFAMACFFGSSEDAAAEKANKGSDNSPVEYHGKSFLPLIEGRLELIKKYEESADSRYLLTEDAEALRLSLPSVEAMEKIQRYENHLNRQLFNAMDQLERLQRQRDGEAVPPPISVRLARRG